MSRDSRHGGRSKAHSASASASRATSGSGLVSPWPRSGTTQNWVVPIGATRNWRVLSYNGLAERLAVCLKGVLPFHGGNSDLGSARAGKLSIHRRNVGTIWRAQRESRRNWENKYESLRH
jgi:hypothetical protein